MILFSIVVHRQLVANRQAPEDSLKASREQCWREYEERLALEDIDDARSGAVDFEVQQFRKRRPITCGYYFASHRQSVGVEKGQLD